MMDINKIRHTNLLALIATHPTQIEFAVAMGMQPARVSHLVRKERNIGEKTARKIEVKAEKPLGWMDQDHSTSDPLLDEALRKLKQVHPDSLAIILGAIENSPKRNQ